MPFLILYREYFSIIIAVLFFYLILISFRFILFYTFHYFTPLFYQKLTICKKIQGYPVVSCCGKNRCETTCFNIKKTNTFQSFATKHIDKINHHFHCDRSALFNFCLVSLLSWIVKLRILRRIKENLVAFLKKNLSFPAKTL